MLAVVTMPYHSVPLIAHPLTYAPPLSYTLRDGYRVPDEMETTQPPPSSSSSSPSVRHYQCPLFCIRNSMYTYLHCTQSLININPHPPHPHCNHDRSH